MSNKNIILLEDRIPNFKEERRKKANKMLIVYISVFFLLSLFILYFQSSLSKIKDINISGTSFISDQEVLEWSKIKPGMNFWDVSEAELVSSIESKHEILENVSVEKKLPSTINIKITEFKKIGYVKNSDHYKVLLENGKFLRNEYKTSELTSMPIFFGWKSEEQLKELSEQLNQLPVGIYNLISEIHFIDNKKNKNIAKLYMSNGYEVRVSIYTLSEKLKYYASIVNQLDPKEKGVIHLEVGSYFKKYVEPITDNNGEEGKNNETTER